MKHEDGESGGTLTAGLGDGVPSIQSTTSGGSPTFAPNETVAERYRIVRLLAGGGMGEVYEAEDLLLRERLALKTIRREAAHDDRMLERFKREIQLARKVTHPNVCRIFDVGFHKDTAFLTMELLAGETLDRRLRRTGRMSTAEAEPIVAQLAAGLAAAHRAGVIHRDFKSANVMLVDDTSGTRAVITDFGLARPTTAPPTDVTGNGGIVGSPSYMAPEQVEGGTVTHAADIYALGVVMYEMVTGRLPFGGDSPLAIAVARLKCEPTPPRQIVPDLDPAWDRVILRCLAVKPGGRWASAFDLVRVLFPARAGETSAEVLSGPRRPRRLWWWIAAAAPVVAVVALAFAVRGPRPPPSAGPLAKRSVAVLGFKNLSGRAEVAWVSKALAEMLSTELAAGDRLRSVPGENVVRAKGELQLGDEDGYSVDTLGKLRQRLGSDLVLMGSYNVSGPKLRFDLTVQDTHSGDTVARVAETGVDTDLVDLVARSGARLRDALAVEAPSPSDEQRARASQPASADVAKLYYEGLDRLRNIACAPARDLLERSVAAGPNYALARVALAEALECLGYGAEARDQAKRAMELGKNLGPRIRMATEALYARVIGDWPHAMDLYGRLFAAEPENIDYGSQLAHMQMKAKKYDELRETVAALRRTRLGDHMVVDLVEADIVREVDHNPAGAVAVLRKVEAKARRLGVPTMAGQAQLSASDILLEQKDFVGAERAALEAQRTFRIERDQDGVAGAAASVATARLAQGKIDAAREAAEDGLRAAHTVGDSRRIPRLVGALVEVFGAAGNLDDAARLLEEEEARARRDNDRPVEAWMLWRRAGLAVERGDLARALPLLDKAKMVPLDTPRPYLTISIALVRSVIAESQGDGAAAHAALEDAIGSLANVEGSDSGVLRVLLARLDLLEGKNAEVEDLLREAAIDLNSDENAYGALALSDALLSSGKLDQAARTFAGARQRTSAALGAFERMFYGIVEARLLAASRRPVDMAEAREKLDDLAARAAAQGYVYANLQARLASGEVSLHAGQIAVGRAVLSSLGKEAKARGFVAVAQRAARLVAQAG
jgi:tRNA A-37 threonylcarbamoyl transferase component Bud32/TolB-like protein